MINKKKEDYYIASRIFWVTAITLVIAMLAQGEISHVKLATEFAGTTSHGTIAIWSGIGSLIAGIGGWYTAGISHRIPKKYKTFDKCTGLWR